MMGNDNRVIFESLVKSGQIRINRGALFDWGPGPVPDTFDFNRVEGMLLGMAIGDALGNTSEGMLPSERQASYGEIRDYLPNRYADSSMGIPSDDTQLAFWTLEQMIADGGFIPENVAQRFCRERIFGIGSTVRQFIANLKVGKPWYKSGPPSAGNGALMRIAPMVIPHLATGTKNLWVDTALSSMITHNDAGSTSACLAFVYILRQVLLLEGPPEQPGGRRPMFGPLAIWRGRPATTRGEGRCVISFGGLFGKWWKIRLPRPILDPCR
jgi:hypothetical protein